jgi:hypothetical protein
MRRATPGLGWIVGHPDPVEFTGPVGSVNRAGLDDPVAVGVRDEHTVNETSVNVSRVRREHPDEIELVLGAVRHQHMAVRAATESGVVTASRVLPLAGLVRICRCGRRKPKGMSAPPRPQPRTLASSPTPPLQ